MARTLPTRDISRELSMGKDRLASLCRTYSYVHTSTKNWGELSALDSAINEQYRKVMKLEKQVRKARKNGEII